MILIKKIIVFLLYLTPIGYFLRCCEIVSGKGIKGLQIDLYSRHKPVNRTSSHITLEGRLEWLISGAFLLFQSIFIAWNNYISNMNNIDSEFSKWAMIYALHAFVFGWIGIISAFSPKYDWKKPVAVLPRLTPWGTYDPIIYIILAFCFFGLIAYLLFAYYYSIFRFIEAF